MFVRVPGPSSLLLAGFVVSIALGCQKSEPAAEPTEEARPVALQVRAQPQSAAERLAGSWSGVFSLHRDAAVEDFDGPTVDICKSIRMRVVFHANGKLEMSASMTLPEIGSQTNDTSGHWSVLSEEGETVRIRSVENGSEAEEVTIVFRGQDSFEMTPPNELKALGVLRFTRS